MNRLLKIGILVMGVGCVALSAIKPWAQAPGPGRSANGELDVIEPGLQAAFQFGTLMMFLLMMVSLLKPFRARLLDTAAASVCLAGALSFPCALILFDPGFVTRIEWLQSQFEHQVWLGGDVSVGFEASATNRPHRFLVVDPPTQYDASERPDWSMGEIGLARLPFLFDWSGYGNAFCQFVGQGWVLAVLGAAAVLVGTMAIGVSRRRTRALVALTTLLIGPGALLAASCLKSFHCGSHLASACRAYSRGDLERALSELEAAEHAHPVYASGTEFVTQRAMLHERLGATTDLAHLGRALLLERRGFRQQSLEVYLDLNDRLDLEESISRVVRMGLIRLAAGRLNRGHETGAQELINRVIQDEACEIKALVMAQIAAVRIQDAEGAGRHASAIYDVCRLMRFPTKKILLADVQRRAVHAEMDAGMTLAVWRRIPKTRNP